METTFQEEMDPKTGDVSTLSGITYSRSCRANPDKMGDRVVVTQETNGFLVWYGTWGDYVYCYEVIGWYQSGSSAFDAARDKADTASGLMATKPRCVTTTQRDMI